ncbi:MAG: DUF6062 family protein [Treponema sp.]|nr:DUF6062 family protein [Treponema sp.]
MAVNKHINFFELQKAAEKPGCPICRIVSDRAEQYIDNMLFEHVSDRPFRALHRAAGGFCPFHSRNMVSFRDGLAVAIMSRDILEDRIEAFDKNKPWRPKGRCPICEERDRIEEEYLGFLAGAIGDSDEEVELRRIFRSSEGLCAPHYAGLLFSRKGRARKVPPWLREFHENKYRDLMKRVSTFIEYSAYGRQSDFKSLSEKDQLVWKEVALVLRGTAE